MDLRKLKTLIDLVSESNVSELEITEAEGKVRIVKSGTTVVQQYMAAAPAPAAAGGLNHAGGKGGKNRAIADASAGRGSGARPPGRTPPTASRRPLP